MKTVAPESMVNTQASNVILFTEEVLAVMRLKAREREEDQRRMDCLLEAFRL